MDKSRRISKRKIRYAIVSLCMVLSFFTHDTIYASDELTSVATGPAITVTTKNSDVQKCYDIKVEWGDMQFVYDYAIPQWDTENLEYSDPGKEGWVKTGFNGINNLLKIENRSNAEITVDLVIELENGVFNKEYSENNVRAYFFDTKEHALQASQILTDLEEAELEGVVTELVLDSAEPVVDDDGVVTKAAGVRSKKAYFAFCGTPDKSLNNTEVGSISLVFTDTSD